MACQVSFGPRFHPRSAPVTFWLIAVSAVLSLVWFFAGLAPGADFGLAQRLMFEPSRFGQQPWSPLTYPLLNPIGPFWFLLLGYMLWWCGADLERWWGSRVQFGFLLAVSVASAGFVALGAWLAPTMAAAPLAGAGPLLAALFCVWGLRNPRQQIILLIVPVSGAVMAALAVAIVWWDYGVYQGFFVALGSAGLGALYWWQGQQFHRLLRRFGGSPQNQAKRREAKAKRDRDKKFQRIMKSSGLHLVDDDEPKEESR